MWESLARGYKLALATLAVELVLSIGLTSNSWAIPAMIAMVFVGIAWLPSGLLLFSDLRQEPDPRLLDFVMATLLGLAGTACLLFLLKSIAMTAYAL